MAARILLALRKEIEGFALVLLNRSVDTIPLGGWSLRFPGACRIDFPQGTELRGAAPNTVEVVARRGENTPSRICAGEGLLTLLLRTHGTLCLYDGAGDEVCQAEGLLGCYEEEVRREAESCTSPMSPSSDIRDSVV